MYSRPLGFAAALALSACATHSFDPTGIQPTSAPRPMVVIDARDVKQQEPPPHGALGMSVATRWSDGVEDRTMEFRQRELLPGAAVGVHRIGHDEVYYLVSGEAIVTSDGEERLLTPGMVAYLYEGAEVGIRQVGETSAVIIIAYPLPGHPRLERK